MHPVRTLLATALALTLFAGAAAAVVVTEEHVTGGVMQLNWLTGFNTDRKLEPLTLDPGHPAYATHPSGDFTVGSLTTAIPDSGGIALSCVDPLGQADYEWEAWVNMGNGDSRRGLVLRADYASNFANSYLFVIYAGLGQIQFRKLAGQTPTSLRAWITNTLPGGVPALNSWHHMKVQASANMFRCWWDGTELTAGNPIVDTNSPYLTGFVGVYNFNFSTGGLTALFDDLVLSTEQVVPAQHTSWGRLKNLYK